MRGAEVFEDHMAEWLLEFQKYLSYENPALVEADSSKESVVDQARKPHRLLAARCAARGVGSEAVAGTILSSASLLQVKAAICENVNLYLEKNETEFADHVEVFAKLVWELLLKVRACGRCLAWR